MPLQRSIKSARRTPQHAAFHLSRFAAWMAIGVVWSITPLSWFYVLYTLITLAPPLHEGIPAPPGCHVVLKIVHYVVLAYAGAEIVFSVVYRGLAIWANRRRPPPKYTRKFLRTVLKRSLEDGMSLSDAEDEAMEDVGLGELSRKLSGRRTWRLKKKRSNRAKRSGSSSSGADDFDLGDDEKELPSSYFQMRKRRSQTAGDGALTPELNDRRMLPDSPARGDPAPTSLSRNAAPSLTPLSTRASDTFNPDQPTHDAAQGLDGAPLRYTPSFISSPLEADDPRAASFRNWLRMWFSGCEFDEIRRLNMADWLAWSLYGQPLQEIEEEREAWNSAGRPPMHIDGELDVDDEGLDIEQDKLGLVNHCLDMIEARAAKTFEPGRNDKIKVIRLTLDPVRVNQRPLLLYRKLALGSAMRMRRSDCADRLRCGPVFVFFVQKILTLLAFNKGFKEVRDGQTRYLVRTPPGWRPNRVSSESNRPLLFVHGLGMGLAQYMTFVHYLSTANTFMERPVVVLLQPHISMSIFSRGYLKPPSETTTVEGIERLAQRHGFDVSGMTVLSHSNGSIVHGWLLRGLPNLITRSCFVDPVCFALWEPDVCYNFLYSVPRTPIEYLMRYFVSRELGIALMLQRTFDWSANLLFPTDIPNLHDPFRTAFYLSEKDSIVNADRVRRYLRRHGVREVKRGANVGPTRGGLKLHHGKKHGESMVGSGVAFDQVCAWVTMEAGEVGLGDGFSSSCS